jgi:hypothetical protein
MPGSGRFMNWDGVAFTPSGGVAQPITEVQNVTIDLRPTLRGASGDADLMPTAKALEYLDPRATVESEDIKSINSIPPGRRGTLVATHNDFINGSGSGAMTYTINNCVVGGGGRSGAHRQVGRGTLEFETFSSDGTTSPVAVSYAS